MIKPQQQTMPLTLTGSKRPTTVSQRRKEHRIVSFCCHQGPNICPQKARGWQKTVPSTSYATLRGHNPVGKKGRKASKLIISVRSTTRHMYREYIKQCQGRSQTLEQTLENAKKLTFLSASCNTTWNHKGTQPEK